MRILVDIPETALATLNCLSKEKKVSRAELARHAVSQYLERHGPESGSKGFGLWKDSPVDAVSHQRKMRNERQR